MLNTRELSILSKAKDCLVFTRKQLRCHEMILETKQITIEVRTTVTKLDKS